MHRPWHQSEINSVNMQCDDGGFAT